MVDTGKILRLARSMFHDRNYACCERLLHLHLNENRLDIDAQVLLAKAYRGMNRHDLALKAADTALTIIRAQNKGDFEVLQLIRELNTEMSRLEQEKRARAEAEAAAAIGALDNHEIEAAAPAKPKWKSDPEMFKVLRGFSPYFGFPDRPHINNTNNYGFRYADGTRPIDYPYVAEHDEYVIGLYGGSVAGGFLQDTIDYMTTSLAAHPDLAGRRVRFLQFAMGSQKQPVSLFYLGYFAALGQEVDLVVNIDGFNDVRNAIVNLELGHHFLMPQALLTKTFDAYVRVPGLDEDYLSYFLEAAKLKRRAAAVASGRFHFFRWIGYLDYLKRRSASLAARPPQTDAEMSLMLTIPMERARFLDLDETAQARLADDVISAWFRCTKLMRVSCEAIGAQYIHAIQPTHFYSNKKHLSPREEEWIVDRPKRDRGQATTKRIIEVCYPKLIQLASSLGEGMYCHMADVFENAREEVFADPDCHFNAVGHHYMARRLCEFLFATKLQVKTPRNG